MLHKLLSYQYDRISENVKAIALLNRDSIQFLGKRMIAAVRAIALCLKLFDIQDNRYRRHLREKQIECCLMLIDRNAIAFLFYMPKR